MKKTKIILPLLWAFFFAGSAFGQLTDSVAYYINLGKSFFPHKADSAEYFYTKALKIKGITDFQTLEIKQELGRVYYILGQYQKSLSLFLQTIETAQNKGYEQNIAVSYNGIGLIYSIQGEIDLAIQNHLQSIKIAEQNNDSGLITRNYLNLSIAYRAKKHNNLDSALYYAQESLSFALKTKNNYIAAMSFNRLARTQFLRKEYHAAIKTIEKFEQTIPEINDWELTFKYSILAECYFQLSEYPKAHRYGHKAFDIARQTNSLWELKRSSDILSRSSAAINNFEQAYQYATLFKTYSDSIYQTEKQEKINYLLLKQQELENKVLAKQIQVQKQQLEVNKLQIYVVILIALGMLSLALLLVIRNRKRKRNNDKLHQLYLQIKQQSQELNDSYSKLQELTSFKKTTNAMIVHDMKNWLNVIIGLGKEELVREAGRNLLNLATNILDVDKFEEAKMKLHFSTHKASDLIDDAVGEVSYFAQINKVTLEKHIDFNALLRIDYPISKRIIVNLLTNAVKFSPKESKVEIKTRQHDNTFIEISVTDYGPGIPPEHIEHIFDRYYQAKPFSLKKLPSTGIGLTFCKMATEAQSGKIWVESETGRFSTFRFLLPIQQN